VGKRRPRELGPPQEPGKLRHDQEPTGFKGPNVSTDVRWFGGGKGMGKVT